jgi:hypothetical protein
MKSSCFLPLSRGSYSLGLSDRRLARRVLFLDPEGFLMIRQEGEEGWQNAPV